MKHKIFSHTSLLIILSVIASALIGILRGKYAKTISGNTTKP